MQFPCMHPRHTHLGVLTKGTRTLAACAHELHAGSSLLLFAASPRTRTDTFAVTLILTSAAACHKIHRICLPPASSHSVRRKQKKRKGEEQLAWAGCLTIRLGAGGLQRVQLQQEPLREQNPTEPMALEPGVR